jgi:teichuronic acid biosynthesis glycosyltransferase TuaC
MNEKLSIITVSQGYASDDKYKSQNVFIHVLMREFMAQGITPTVISPEPQFIFTRHVGLRRRFFRAAPQDGMYDGIRVIRPRFITYPARKLPIAGSTFSWSLRNFKQAVIRGYQSYSAKPQFCYGHFLYKEGSAALHIAERLGIPAVVALGEYSFDHYEEHVGLEQIRADLSRFSRIIAVSQNIRDKCVHRYGVSEERIAVFPNGVDHEVFYPRERSVMRSRLGLPQDRPIVAFVGSFTERKGPARLLEAIESRPDIGIVLLGNGFARPMGPQVLFNGSVPHNEVPNWLTAADLFVLPTLAEGSCNALLEAMACGLPVVTSDIPANRELLGSDEGILVNPRDIGQIRQAVETLVDDPARRRAMGLAAHERARQYSSRARAQKILAWLRRGQEL